MAKRYTDGCFGRFRKKLFQATDGYNPKGSGGFVEAVPTKTAPDLMPLP
jgi:hypothetical protein